MIKLASAALDTVTGAVTNTASSAGLGSSPQSTTALVSGIINVVLGALGLLVLSLIVYSGFEYLTSLGEPEKIKKAKKILTYSIIGLVIVVTSYALSVYVIQALSSTQLK